MYVFHTRESEEEWQQYVSLNDSYNTQARLLSPEVTVDVFPALDPDEIRGSLWAPDCGNVDPYTVTQAMASAATELGPNIETNTSVLDVTTESGRVTAIETNQDRYEVDYVANAAGPWAPKIGEMVGLAIPIERIIRQIMVTDRIEHDNGPLIIDREREFYFEMEESGSFLACDIHDVTGMESSLGDIRYEYYLQTSEKLKTLALGLGDLEIIIDWAGYQSHTSDGHAVLGPTSVEGFVLPVGCQVTVLCRLRV
jgi:sarcosine oxidase subunit beta